MPWRKKYHCGGHSWRGGLFKKQLKKWVKTVFLLGCCGCIFHGTGNSAQLCQNFGISGGGGVWTPHTPPRYATASLCHGTRIVVTFPVHTLMERRPTRQDSPEKVKILSQGSQDSSMVLFLVLGVYSYVTNIVFHFLSARLSYYRNYLIQPPTHTSEWRPEVTRLFVR